MACDPVYPKLENLATTLGIILEKSLKKNFKKHWITKFLCVIFFHFKAFSYIPSVL